MIAATESFATPSADLHAQFLELLPKIETHARIFFRGIKCSTRRADQIHETVALAWKWYRRLVEQGKDVTQFAMVFIYLVAKAVKSGRRLVGTEKAKDIMNPVAQRKHGFKVEPLPIATRTCHEHIYSDVGGQRRLDEYEERLHDNTRTPPPEQAAFRIDWPRFLRRLPQRDRELAKFLSLGHPPSRAAKRFGLTPGRVTQLRQQWCKDWEVFEGEEALEWRRRSRGGKKTMVMS